MTLDQLRYFVAASKFEHVGKAARSVHISPGAVSTAILALERELKGQLFRRHRQRIYLNPRGKALRREAEQIFRQLNQVRRRLQAGRVAIEGSYRLGASHFLASRFLTTAWTTVLREQPRLSGEICSMSTAMVLNEVLRGTLDFGLCFSPLVHPDLASTVLHRGRLLIAVARRHPLLRAKARAAFRLPQLNSYPATLHKAAPGIDICETHPSFEKYGIKPSISFLFDGDDAAVENLRRSRAWSLLPDIVIRSAPELAPVPHPRGWRADYIVALVCRRAQEKDFVFELVKRKLRGAIRSGVGRA